MAAGHTHASTETGSDVRLRTPGRLRVALLAVVVLTGLVTLLAGAWLWPRGPLPHAAGVGQIRQDDATAEIVAVQRQACAGTTDDRTLTGAIPASVACATVHVRLLDGPEAGRVVTLAVTGPTVNEGLAVGVRAVVARFPDAVAPSSSGSGLSRGTSGSNSTSAGSAAAPAQPVYAWIDFDRSRPMLLLAAAFAVVVLIIARFRGLAALAGVGLGLGMVTLFLLPALQRGENPALVTLVGCTAVMLLVLYASHGISAKTTSALLGTLTALGVTAGLAIWATGAAHLDGQTGEDALSLSQLVGAGTISATVISGLVLAGLGVLNDVTVAQASSIWELRAAAPHLTAPALFRSGMRIGRDHLASTVYTVAFAYAGLSLPVLLLIQTYGRPLSEVITSGAIAQDVVGVLVAGIGLALAIPLTTAIAALIAHTCTTSPATEPDTGEARRRHQHIHRHDDHDEAPVDNPYVYPVAAGALHEDQFREGVLVRRRRPRVDDPDDDPWPSARL